MSNDRVQPAAAPDARRRLVRRVRAFSARLRWMARLTGDRFSAAALLLRIKANPEGAHTIRIDGCSVQFRGKDEQALREVFVDREYAFLDDGLAAAAEPSVLDIGAHIGTFAIWCLKANPAARILSVEPDPESVALTHANASTRVRAGADWTVRHAAAGARDGDVLRLMVDGPSMSHRVDPSGAVEVESVSLTTLLDQLAPDGGSVDFVKVDIEGSEEDVLCAKPAALDRVGVLVIELHPTLCDTARVDALLRARFDTVEVIGGRQSSKPLLLCQRTAAAAP